MIPSSSITQKTGRDAAKLLITDIETYDENKDATNIVAALGTVLSVASTAASVTNTGLSIAEATKGSKNTIEILFENKSDFPIVPYEAIEDGLMLTEPPYGIGPGESSSMVLVSSSFGDSDSCTIKLYIEADGGYQEIDLFLYSYKNYMSILVNDSTNPKTKITIELNSFQLLDGDENGNGALRMYMSPTNVTQGGALNIQFYGQK